MGMNRKPRGDELTQRDPDGARMGKRARKQKKDCNGSHHNLGAKKAIRDEMKRGKLGEKTHMCPLTSRVKEPKSTPEKAWCDANRIKTTHRNRLQ